jgi:hypothetical protein
MHGHRAAKRRFLSFQPLTARQTASRQRGRTQITLGIIAKFALWADRRMHAGFRIFGNGLAE